jgi:mono/diheme cytochrome c family protein
MKPQEKIPSASRGPVWVVIVAAVLLFALSACFGNNGNAQSSAGNSQSTEPGGTAEADDEPPYIVKCSRDEDGTLTGCAVDQATYIGWRTFGGNCAQCHGQDAVGSSFAPSLVRRIGEISEERFFEVLEHGITGTGDSAMPPFGENPNVWPHRERIYGYLKARSEGGLPPGRPDRIPQD